MMRGGKQAATWLLLASLGLHACDKPINEGEARDVAEDEADARVAPLERRVSELEAKVDGMRRQVDGLQGLTIDNTNQTAGLRETLNHNAQVNNANALRDMTRRGACGYRPGPPGTNIISEPIPCTEEDLAK